MRPHQRPSGKNGLRRKDGCITVSVLIQINSSKSLCHCKIANRLSEPNYIVSCRCPKCILLRCQDLKSCPLRPSQRDTHWMLMSLEWDFEGYIQCIPYSSVQKIVCNFWRTGRPHKLTPRGDYLMRKKRDRLHWRFEKNELWTLNSKMEL